MSVRDEARARFAIGGLLFFWVASVGLAFAAVRSTQPSAFSAADANSITAAATVGLFVVTALLALFTYFLFGATVRLEESARRPHLRLRRAYLNLSDNRRVREAVVTIEIANVGTGVAAAECRIGFHRTSKPNFLYHEMLACLDSGKSNSMSIAPGSSALFVRDLRENMSVDLESPSVENGTEVVRIVGYIAYADQRGQIEYRTGFLVRFEHGNTGLLRTDERDWNYED
ncbi:MAG: hypothetical protein HY275_03585 [Gemmatimonadetes bacterium]|nr:hypothetical protein [Gemmatimonadota bacterium]